METGILFLQNLRKTYGNKTAVNIAALEIQPHTFTCIVGKSGCGKTTLLRLLAGLETPDSGTDIKANESGSDSTISNRNNLTNAAKNNRSSCISGLPAKTAPVFQEPRLMPWLTVRENIIFALKGNTATNGQTSRMKNTNSIAPSETSPEDRCKQLLKELELTEAANLYRRKAGRGKD